MNDQIQQTPEEKARIEAALDALEWLIQEQTYHQLSDADRERVDLNVEVLASEALLRAKRAKLDALRQLERAEEQLERANDTAAPIRKQL